MTPRPCLGLPGRPCGRLTRNGTRCLDCAAVFNRAGQWRRDAQRPSPAERGYGSDWRKLRIAVLARDGWTCHWCGGPANTVDHVIPLALGGARLDPTNVVASCRRCNSRRGGQTRRGP